MEITRELNRNLILADGFELLAHQGNSIPLMEEFERVEKLRPQEVTKRNPTSSPWVGQTLPPGPSPNEPNPGSAGGLAAGALKDPGEAGASAPPPFQVASDPAVAFPTPDPQLPIPEPPSRPDDARVP